MSIIYTADREGGKRKEKKSTWNSLAAEELKRSSLSSCPWLWLAPFKYSVMFPLVCWPGPGPHRGCQIAAPCHYLNRLRKLMNPHRRVDSHIRKLWRMTEWGHTCRYISSPSPKGSPHFEQRAQVGWKWWLSPACWQLKIPEFSDY